MLPIKIPKKHWYESWLIASNPILAGDFDPDQLLHNPQAREGLRVPQADSFAHSRRPARIDQEINHYFHPPFAHP